MAFALVVILAFCCLFVLVASAVGLRTFRTREQRVLLRRLEALKGGASAQVHKESDAKNKQKIIASGRIWKFVYDCMGYDPEYRIYKTISPTVMFLVAAIVSLSLVYAASVAIGKMAWVFVPVIFILSIRFYLKHCLRRYHKDLFVQFPDALGTIVRCIRVGISVPQAIEHVAESAPEPTKSQFSAVAEQLSIGAGMEDALARLSKRNALQEYKFFAVALSLQAQTGGSISETLENLSEIIRKRAAASAKGHALIAEAKMSTMVLAGLPFVTVAGLAVTSYSYVKPLFFDPHGREILAAAIFVWALGLFVMRTMIQRVLS